MKRRQRGLWRNRAAAYLLPGEGVDLNKALADDMAAEKADPTYFLSPRFQRTSHIQSRKQTMRQQKHCAAKTSRTMLAWWLTEGKGFSDDEGILGCGSDKLTLTLK